LNSGEKVFIFDLQKILLEGNGGLLEVFTHSQILKRCHFYPVNNRKKGYIHPEFMQRVHEQAPIVGVNGKGKDAGAGAGELGESPDADESN